MAWWRGGVVAWWRGGVVAWCVYSCMHVLVSVNARARVCDIMCRSCSLHPSLKDYLSSMLLLTQLMSYFSAESFHAIHLAMNVIAVRVAS